MHRLLLSRPRAGGPRIAVRGLPVALAAGLVLTVNACMTPSAKQSSAAGAAGQQTAKAESGAVSGKVGDETAKRQKPWWRRLIRPDKPHTRPGDIEPGRPGLFSGEAGEIVLYRKDKDDGQPSASGKPKKIRR